MRGFDARFFIFMFFLLLQGCAVYGVGYTPKASADFNVSNRSNSNITFSVSYSQHVGDAGPVTKERLVKKVKQAIKDTGAYRSARYTSIEGASEHHLHFEFHFSGAGYEESAAIGMLSGLTLMTIPMGVSYYSDMSVFVIENGDEVFSLGAAEKINYVIWLPLIIATPFFNNYTAANGVLSKQASYLMSRVAQRNL